jgi:hypothetical protein
MNALNHTRHRRGVAFNRSQPAPWSPGLPGRLVRDFRRMYNRLGREKLQEESHSWQLTLFMNERLRPKDNDGLLQESAFSPWESAPLMGHVRSAFLNCRKYLFGMS